MFLQSTVGTLGTFSFTMIIFIFMHLKSCEIPSGFNLWCVKCLMCPVGTSCSLFCSELMLNLIWVLTFVLNVWIHTHLTPPPHFNSTSYGTKKNTDNVSKWGNKQTTSLWFHSILMCIKFIHNVTQLCHLPCPLILTVAPPPVAVNIFQALYHVMPLLMTLTPPLHSNPAPYHSPAHKHDPTN